MARGASVSGLKAETRTKLKLLITIGGEYNEANPSRADLKT
jgi:hypothetical protein